jgi:hypothetical protein
MTSIYINSGAVLFFLHVHSPRTIKSACFAVSTNDHYEGCFSIMLPCSEVLSLSLMVLLATTNKHASAEGAVSETARASDETGSRLSKRNSGRDRRPSVWFHGPDWYR